MEKPRLLISVTGGAKSFNMDPKLKEHFARGLLKVCMIWYIVLKKIMMLLQSLTCAQTHAGCVILGARLCKMC